MNMKNKVFLFSLVFLGIAGWGPISYAKHRSTGSKNWIRNEMALIEPQADNLDPTVLKLSLKAYLKAREEGLDQKEMLTIIDYSKPSTERRLWVIDLKDGKVLFNTWVSHGRNSGEVNATSFSNEPGSLKSSYGVFETMTVYEGHNGESLHLKGLEPGINDNAYRRSIVMHGAWYVSPRVIDEYGTLGRSWGCPAVREQLAKPIINTIKGNTILFAYYPNQKWLKTSEFLSG